jgi:hypothetical protein
MRQLLVICDGIDVLVTLYDTGEVECSQSPNSTHQWMPAKIVAIPEQRYVPERNPRLRPANKETHPLDGGAF